MRICFVTTMSGYAWGGSEELWTAAAGLALELGHDVAALTYLWPVVPPKLRLLEQRGMRLFRRPLGRRTRLTRAVGRMIPARPVVDSRSVRAKFERYVDPWRVLFKWKPDVVCVSQGSTYDLLNNSELLRFLVECAVPFVILCQHNFEDRGLRSEEQRQNSIACFAKARRVAFVADRNLLVAERQLGIRLEKGCVVRNPVNLSDLSLVRWQITDMPGLAHVARLDPLYKGQDVLLEVLSTESWKARPWRLRFYGEGPDQSYLERLAGLYGISGRVEFRGHVADIRSIWADNQILLMPSRSEGTPLSLVEAMLCGRPAVVTDVGGNAEWIEEPVSGFIADAPSVRSFGATLERAWQARSSWEGMGRVARQTAIHLIGPNPAKSLLELLIHDRVPRLVPEIS